MNGKGLTRIIMIGNLVTDEEIYENNRVSENENSLQGSCAHSTEERGYTMQVSRGAMHFSQEDRRYFWCKSREGDVSSF